MIETKEKVVKRISYSKIRLILFLSVGILFTACSSILMLARSNKTIVTLEEVPKALAKARGGDTIVLKPGNYDNLRLTISGKPNSRLVIRPQQYGTVKLTGRSTITIKDSRNIKLDGLLFEDTPSNTLVINNSQNIEIANNYFLRCGSSPVNTIMRFQYNASNNKVYNNTFEDNRSMGIIIVNNSRVVEKTRSVKNKIYNNLFYNIQRVKDVYPSSDGNGLEAIQVGQSSGLKLISARLNTEIYNNLFENIIGDGVEIISVKASNTKILNNTFLNNASGITVRTANYVNIRGNYLLNTTRGIRLYGYGHNVSNNYIEGSDIAINMPSTNLVNGEEMLGSGSYYQQEDCDITGNIIVEPKREAFALGIGVREFHPTNIRLSNNKVILENDDALGFAINPDVSLESIEFRGNELYTRSNRAARSARIDTRMANPARQILYSDEQNPTQDMEEVYRRIGMRPFDSLDKSVGATWKRP